jgi:hypothetical protein
MTCCPENNNLNLSFYVDLEVSKSDVEKFKSILNDPVNACYQRGPNYELFGDFYTSRQVFKNSDPKDVHIEVYLLSTLNMTLKRAYYDQKKSDDSKKTQGYQCSIYFCNESLDIDANLFNQILHRCFLETRYAKVGNNYAIFNENNKLQVMIPPNNRCYDIEKKVGHVIFSDFKPCASLSSPRSLPTSLALNIPSPFQKINKYKVIVFTTGNKIISHEEFDNFEVALTTLEETFGAGTLIIKTQNCNLNYIIS